MGIVLYTHFANQLSQITLMEGCQDILQSDCRNLSDRLMDGQRRAFLGNGESAEILELYTLVRFFPC